MLSRTHVNRSKVPDLPGTFLRMQLSAIRRTFNALIPEHLEVK